MIHINVDLSQAPLWLMVLALLLVCAVEVMRHHPPEAVEPERVHARGRR